MPARSISIISERAISRASSMDFSVISVALLMQSISGPVFTSLISERRLEPSTILASGSLLLMRSKRPGGMLDESRAMVLPVSFFSSRALRRAVAPSASDLVDSWILIRRSVCSVGASGLPSLMLEGP